MELTQTELSEAMSQAKERDTHCWTFKIPFYVSLKRMVREFDPCYSGAAHYVGWILVDYTIEVIKHRPSSGWTTRYQKWTVTTSYKHVCNIYARSVWGRHSEIKKYWHFYKTPWGYANDKKDLKRLRDLAVDDAVAGIDRYTRVYLNRLGRIRVWWKKRRNADL